MAPQLCQVCNSHDSKYKCPGCGTASCSLPCFRQHKDVCLDSNAQRTSSLINTAADNEAAAEQNIGPSALSAADLSELFQKFPNLREELRRIYTSTRDPAGLGDGAATDLPQGRDRGGYARRPWKPETGIENGLAALKHALDNDVANSEAVTAFLALLAEKPQSHERSR